MHHVAHEQTVKKVVFMELILQVLFLQGLTKRRWVGSIFASSVQGRIYRDEERGR